MSPEMRLEDYLDPEGNIAIPAGVTLTSFLDRNVEQFADEPAYQYLDFDHDRTVQLTWSELGARLRAIGGRLQHLTRPGDRVAILAPQGVDYIVAFFAAIHAGAIAVPLFAPELPGHTERLEAVLDDARPTVVLTTTSAAKAVGDFLRTLPREHRPRMMAVDAVPDTVGAGFMPVPLDTDGIAYLQYTSGSTRTPAGVQITHRSACTNIVQMAQSVGLDLDIRSVSWLPLFHDMGLLMIMFPAMTGKYLSLMSPVSFVRRPYRWIKELGATDKPMFAAAPNFAFELAATRGLPPAGEHLDLSNVAGLINGSEPVSMASVNKFIETFAPYGLKSTAIKPSYGMAEATLFVSTTAPNTAPKAVHLDRHELNAGRAVCVDADHPNAVAQVSCGHVARSQWAVIVDPRSEAELPDGHVGEIWLHGDNIGAGYWGRTEETELTFVNKLQTRLEVGSHAQGCPEGAHWLRTGDLGVYVDGELHITGRIKDMVIVDGRNHYPQDIEATVANVSPVVRSGFVAAFSVPGATGEVLVIVAERAPGKGKVDAAPVTEAIRAAVSRTHALPIADVKLVAAGSIPRTTSGKLARRACRAKYLDGTL
ncbi:fatty acyl-AMP ligase [Mycolicibacterium vaccae]|uniref:fatty acyl-AMP ligase n=1 Tax=Mycolicibacterium vaccae TaxID=1810 RepID=UPI003D067B64